MKDIEFKLNSMDIKPNSEIRGTISVSYPGRYDGVVINTQILDSNEHIVYKSYNGKNISQKCFKVIHQQRCNARKQGRVYSTNQI